MARSQVSNIVSDMDEEAIDRQIEQELASLKTAKSRKVESRQSHNANDQQAVAEPGHMVVVGGGNMDSSNAMAVSQQSRQSLSTQVDSNEEEKRSYNARFELFLALGLMALVVVLFVLGHHFWDERYYIPAEGLGYYLGLVGGVLMLLAYSYSLFKYTAFFRRRAVMHRWLTVHICLGVIGPLLVIFHSTFHIHSLNGGIALISMLLVFTSGVMARFIYAKTHYGLGDSKVQVQDLKEQLELAGHKIKSERLDTFTASVLDHRDSLLYAFWDFMTFGWRSRWIYFRITENMRHHLKVLAKKKGWGQAVVQARRQEFNQRLRDYIFVLRKVALFRVYERFFAFWRNAHAPLLYLLLMSGIVHVIAVHMY